jgi:hypothetical protein
MLRINLLLTTALLAVASLSISAAHSGTLARTPSAGVADRPHLDANTKFMCQYGGYLVSAANSGISTYSASRWVHEALPITGQGKTVHDIIVKELSATGFGLEFWAGIYSDAGGVPGKLIAGGNGRARKHCRSVTISIAPTTLQSNTTYWIMEKMASRNGRVNWAVDPKSKSYAYKQDHHFSSSNSIVLSSSTSPWTKNNSSVYVRLK